MKQIISSFFLRTPSKTLLKYLCLATVIVAFFPGIYTVKVYYKLLKKEPLPVIYDSLPLLRIIEQGGVSIFKLDTLKKTVTLNSVAVKYKVDVALSNSGDIFQFDSREDNDAFAKWFPSLADYDLNSNVGTVKFLDSVSVKVGINCSLDLKSKLATNDVIFSVSLLNSLIYKLLNGPLLYTSGVVTQLPKIVAKVKIPVVQRLPGNAKELLFQQTIIECRWAYILSGVVLANIWILSIGCSIAMYKKKRDTEVQNEGSTKSEKDPGKNFKNGRTEKARDWRVWLDELQAGINDFSAAPEKSGQKLERLLENKGQIIQEFKELGEYIAKCETCYTELWKLEDISSITNAVKLKDYFNDTFHTHARLFEELTRRQNLSGEEQYAELEKAYISFSEFKKIESYADFESSKLLSFNKTLKREVNLLNQEFNDKDKKKEEGKNLKLELDDLNAAIADILREPNRPKQKLEDSLKNQSLKNFTSLKKYIANSEAWNTEIGNLKNLASIANATGLKECFDPEFWKHAELFRDLTNKLNLSGKEQYRKLEESYNALKEFEEKNFYSEFADSKILAGNKNLKRDLEDLIDKSRKIYDCKSIEEFFELIQGSKNAKNLKKEFLPYEEARNQTLDLNTKIKSGNTEAFIKLLSIDNTRDAYKILKDLRGLKEKDLEQMQRAIENYPQAKKSLEETKVALDEIADKIRDADVSWFEPYMMLLALLHNGNYANIVDIYTEVNVLGQLDRGLNIAKACKAADPNMNFTDIKSSASLVDLIDKYKLRDERQQHNAKRLKEYSEPMRQLSLSVGHAVKQEPIFTSLYKRYHNLYEILLKGGFNKDGTLNEKYREYLKTVVELSVFMHDYMKSRDAKDSDRFTEENIGLALKDESSDHLPSGKYLEYVDDGDITPYEVLSMKRLQEYMGWQSLRFLIKGYKL